MAAIQTSITRGGAVRDVGRPAANEAAPQPRVRLDFLDGLRGCAALYVVLYHASHEAWIVYGLPPLLRRGIGLLSYGHFAVAVFIVLSGYSLMLPVVAGDGALTGGFGGYLRRRARRIMPPYYAALLFSLALIAAQPLLRDPVDSQFNSAVPAFTPSAWLPHLLLIQNLSADWIWRIDPPGWSVATEWQIYFVFPALLLPVWRRAGSAVCIAVAFAVGLAPHFVFGSRFDGAAPWYLGLFAMGMAGAVIGTMPAMRRLRETAPWWPMAAAVALLCAAIVVVAPGWWWSHLWISDPLVGLGAALLIIAAARSLEAAGGRRPPAVVRALGSRPVTVLGSFSYSLYLVNLPLLATVSMLMRERGVSPTAGLAVMLLAVPAVVGVAYVFHLAFERPFLSGRARTAREAVAATVASPAP